MFDWMVPNVSLMRHPGNWLVVGFVLIIIVSASHILFGRYISEGTK